MPVQAAYDKPTHIYVLRDPNTGAARYVGATVKPLKWRLSMHLWFARTKRKTSRLMLWLRTSTPTIHLLEIVPPGGDWQSRESDWIASLRPEGLLNETDGGIGLRGRKHTAATKQKMSAWQVGLERGPHSLESNQRRSASLRGRSLTAEHRAKIGEANRRRTLSPETRKKISDSLKRKRGDHEEPPG